jgi:hypothetical protein
MSIILQPNTGLATRGGSDILLPDALYLKTQIQSQLYPRDPWEPAKKWIREVGSKRRYFERLSVLVTAIVFVDNGPPSLYLKFSFNSS